MRIPRRLAMLCCLLLALPLLASEPPRPITHEDLWLMPRVGAPQVSPDGRQAVFQVTSPAYDNDAQASHLWLVPTDGSEAPRQLTFLRSGESAVTWSPDSRQIAFVARRDNDDVPQVYLLDLARGGEAQRVTSISTGARDPVFSPDGRRIAFTSDVHPDSQNDEDSRRIQEEEKARKHEVHTYTGFPVRNWDRWLTERQPRLLVQVIGESEATDLLAGSELVASPGYAGRGNSLDAAWAPDGESLIFAATRNLHRSAFDFSNTELWQVPASGGEPRRLTGGESLESGPSWGTPRFSADGRSLFALRIPRTDRVYNASRLVRLSWPAAEEQAEIVLPEARAILDFAISPDNRELFMLADDAGHVKLYRAPARGGEARLAFDMDRGIYTNLSISRTGRTPVLLANFESAVNPAEVVRIDVRRGGHQRLTEFAVEAAAALDLQPLEHVWFENEEGMRIHSLLARPANFDPTRKYPLVVMMHGGPHLMSRDYFFLRWNYHLLAGEDYVVLSPNYRGSTGFGEAFAQSIERDPLRGPANDINQAAAAAVAQFDFIDSERRCAAGASYGGHLASWLLSMPGQYHCLVNHAGLVNLVSQWGSSDVVFHREANVGSPPWENDPLWQDQNPLQYAADWVTPTLVTAGELDFRVPINNTLELWTVLQRQQVESRLLVFPKENHWIMNGHNSRHFYGELADWFARWLLDEAEED